MPELPKKQIQDTGKPNATAMSEDIIKSNEIKKDMIRLLEQEDSIALVLVAKYKDKILVLQHDKLQPGVKGVKLFGAVASILAEDDNATPNP